MERDSGARVGSRGASNRLATPLSHIACVLAMSSSRPKLRLIAGGRIHLVRVTRPGNLATIRKSRRVALDPDRVLPAGVGCFVLAAVVGVVAWLAGSG